MTRSTIAPVLFALLTLGACGSPKGESDTTQAIAPVDTVKPAPVLAPDSMAADSMAAAAKTRPAPTRTTTTRVRTDTTRIIGRDSVIMPTGKGGLPPIKPDTL